MTPNGNGTASTIVTTSRDGVIELKLNRPDRRNALTSGLLRELRVHLTLIGDDPDVRAVILTGSGDAFCAGADLKEIPPEAPAWLGQTRLRLIADVLRRLRELEQPTIAAVNGPAVGAGWGLALACDLCFAVSGASFGLPEVARGFRLPEPLTRRLVEVAGPIRAADVMFGGQSYPAEHVLAAGWVTRVLPGAPELSEEAWRFAGCLAAAPRRAVAGAKQSLRPDNAMPSARLAWTDD
ncbi:MAG TPA: enoyl-CoA hydratase/isomerase family protein [Streptosporangiaceae bacterium]|nr:enoyl-CoA hydratase/isomerase family protein [Streptosporangiaceae bacterium]